MVLTGNSDLYNRIPVGSCGRTDAILSIPDSRIWRRRYQIHGSFRISFGKEKIILSDGMCVMFGRRILPYYVEMWKADQKRMNLHLARLVLGIMMTLFAGDQLIHGYWQGI